jgi:hypothetical protein
VPDPDVKPPVRTAKQGDKFVCVDASGKMIGESSYSDRAAADRACATINAAWKRAKRERSEKSKLYESAKFDERLHPRNRVGEFTDVLGKLAKAATPTVPKSLPNAASTVRAPRAGRSPDDRRYMSSGAAKRTTASDYLGQQIDYGGVMTTRADVIADLRKQGLSQQYIDRYLQGADARARRRLREGRERAVHFDPAEHPRDRIGRFVNVLARLRHGEEAMLPGGISVFKKAGHYKVVARGGSSLGRTRSASAAAAAAMGAFDTTSGGVGMKRVQPIKHVPTGIIIGGGGRWSYKSWAPAAA